jgi:coenzyme F420-reducing hydrogenase beta subunit
MGAYELNLNTELTIIEACASCGIAWAVPKHYLVTKQEEGGRGVVYCPNGHTNVWDKSPRVRELELKLEQSNKLRTYADQARDRALDLAEKRKKHLTVTKGKLTKLKNRVGNGVCPCCNRSFVNMAEHMKKQHPDFKKE